MNVYNITYGKQLLPKASGAMIHALHKRARGTSRSCSFFMNYEQRKMCVGMIPTHSVHCESAGADKGRGVLRLRHNRLN